MKLIIKAAAIGLGVLALGACNKHTDAGDNVVANADTVADNVEANADNAADTIRANAENTADKVDNAVENGTANSATGNTTKK
ncbi:MAG: hypothetical protein JWO81_1304 [Alphaproteobacteria bacterium]|nr:hypothetical protein [Alphaproteobacteria bacterium]